MTAVIVRRLGAAACWEGDQVYGESTIPALLRLQSGELIPDPAEIFADGFESGSTSAW